MLTLEVFRACAIAGIGAGMAGVLWTGIEAVELYAALTIQDVPRAHWSDVADDVRFMGDVVADERNKRGAARAK